MNTDTETVPAASVNQSRRIDQSVAPAKKQAGGAKPKAARAAKATKASARPLRSSRAVSTTEKLVCRYCGSDDLAPSFKKRRDARCRACFKKRYGSARRRRRPRALGRRRPPSRFSPRSNRIGSGFVEEPGSDRGSLGFATRSHECLERIQVSELYNTIRLLLSAPEQRQIDSPGERL